MNIKHLIATALLAGVGIVAGLTGTANASTGGCTAGAYAGYCSTQTDADSPALSFDVFHQAATVNNKIIGYPNADTDKATDFYTFAYQGGTTKVFEYAPNGVASNLCISEPSQGAGLVLRVCNGSQWQRFTAKDVGNPALPSAPDTYTWANSATGDIIASHGKGAQLTGVLPPGVPGVPTAAERWVFAG